MTTSKNNKVGRPLKFRTSTELQHKIDDFFLECKENHTIPTITKLAVYLDTTRRTLLDYENGGEYSHTIKRAKAIIESHIEDSLLTSRNQTGAIFNLKNNFGWTDEKIVTHQTQGKELDQEDKERLNKLLIVPSRVVVEQTQTIAITPNATLPIVQPTSQPVLVSEDKPINETKPTTTQCV